MDDNYNISGCMMASYESGSYYLAGTSSGWISNVQLFKKQIKVSIECLISAK